MAHFSDNAWPDNSAEGTRLMRTSENAMNVVSKGVNPQAFSAKQMYQGSDKTAL